jgi:hypothetical protein
MSLSHAFSVSQTPPKPATSPANTADFGFGSSAAIHQYAGHAYTIARITDQISRWYSRYHARKTDKSIDIGPIRLCGAILTTAACLLSTQSAAQQSFPWTTALVTQTAGTVTLGGTFQTALAANGNRKGCLVQNTSSRTLLVYVGTLGDATTLNAAQVAPGGVFACGSGPIVATQAVNVTTTTTSDPFVVLSMQ